MPGSTKIIPPKNFDFEGHRGCRGIMPENTIAGFIKAINLGVTTLEMDVVITQDSEVVVSHEPFFNHEISTGPNEQLITEAIEKQLNIYKMDYATVKLYDVGLKPHPRFPKQEKKPAQKPLLREVIDSVENYIQKKGLLPVQYNIETKTKPSTDNIYHPNPSVFVNTLLQVITSKHIEQRTIIQSFDIRTLQLVHKEMPALKTAYLFEDLLAPSLEKRLAQLGFIPSIYSPSYEFVTKHLVNDCHKKGMKLIPWTVNDVPKMKRLIALGVDGLISDYPNLYKELK